METKRRSRWESEGESGSDEERNQVKPKNTKKMKKSQEMNPQDLTGVTGATQGFEEIEQQEGKSEHHDQDKSHNLKKICYNPLIEGCRSVEVYQRLNFIDQGTYGVVFRAKCTETNQIVAIKQVKLGINENRAGFPITALREINILLSLKHPNIVDVKEMVVGSSIDKMYMVMEYLENDLKSCMQSSASPFSIAEVELPPSVGSSSELDQDTHVTTPWWSESYASTLVYSP
jgi:serine/threonine protein kinase